MPIATPAVLFGAVTPARLPPGKPLLQVVVDTEEVNAIDTDTG